MFWSPNPQTGGAPQRLFFCPQTGPTQEKGRVLVPKHAERQKCGFLVIKRAKCNKGHFFVTSLFCNQKAAFYAVLFAH